jgi:hypothetical protein
MKSTHIHTCVRSCPERTIVLGLRMSRQQARSWEGVCAHGTAQISRIRGHGGARKRLCQLQRILLALSCTSFLQCDEAARIPCTLYPYPVSMSMSMSILSRTSVPVRQNPSR